MRRFYFPIFHKGETQADDVGELLRSAEIASQYGARVARDIASDPDCDHDAGTVVIVIDATGAEMARHSVASFATAI
ncbi:hypothetical protein FXB41_28675 [Bradyrhizobium canariense]|nr:hypothetical protein [Bradyrhizobium canariense]